MYYETDKKPLEIDFYASRLIGPEQFVPQLHYHYAERQNWIKLYHGLPNYGTENSGLADQL